MDRRHNRGVVVCRISVVQNEMNGKGDSYRPVVIDKYEDKYDQIDWTCQQDSVYSPDETRPVEETGGRDQEADSRGHNRDQDSAVP